MSTVTESAPQVELKNLGVLTDDDGVSYVMADDVRSDAYIEAMWDIYYEFVEPVKVKRDGQWFPVRYKNGNFAQKLTVEYEVVVDKFNAFRQEGWPKMDVEFLQRQIAGQDAYTTKELATKELEGLTRQAVKIKDDDGKEVASNKYVELYFQVTENKDVKQKIDKAVEKWTAAGKDWTEAKEMSTGKYHVLEHMKRQLREKGEFQGVLVPKGPRKVGTRLGRATREAARLRQRLAHIEVN